MYFYEWNQSEPFDRLIGVRQGENLSPLLFSIFINDMEDFFKDRGCNELEFDNDVYISNIVKIMVLLYADDTILLADTPLDLQLALDSLDLYCEKWKLQVNSSKTKIMIFSKRKSKLLPKFTLKGQKLDIVDQFLYLGIIFSSNGSFVQCTKHVYKKAQNAMYALIKKGRECNLPIDVYLNMFDSTIVPILLYGCEVWGPSHAHTIEKLHLKFRKHILRLNRTTPNVMVYGELGQCPLDITIKVRMVTFWARLLQGKSSNLSHNMYFILFNLFIKQMYI